MLAKEVERKFEFIEKNSFWLQGGREGTAYCPFDKST